MHFAVVLESLLRSLSFEAICHLVKVVNILFTGWHFRIETHVNVSGIQNTNHILHFKYILPFNQSQIHFDLIWTPLYISVEHALEIKLISGWWRTALISEHMIVVLLHWGW